MAVSPILAIADDLTGAAEVASALAFDQVNGARIVLHSPTRDDIDDLWLPGSPVLVVDTGSRDIKPEHAATTVARITSGLPNFVTIFKKVDSLLRGNTGCELTALGEQSMVILAPALPQSDRTVEDGILRIARKPLSETQMWANELSAPPRRISELFARDAAVELSMDEIRAGGLREFHAMRRGIVICDARTDSDLDAIVSTAPAHAILAGSRALAEALRRHSAGVSTPLQPVAPTGPASISPVLVVVGTTAPSATEQVAEVRSRGVRVVELDPHQLDALDSTRFSGDNVVLVSLAKTTRPAAGSQLASDLAHALRGLAEQRNLILTGGETARHLLDELGITTLTYAATIEPGLIETTARSRKRIVTRPGSFGTRDSLVHAIEHLTTPIAPQRAHTRDHSMTRRPRIAVTMGDAAGVGPEIVVSALLEAEIINACTPIIIGDANRLRQAARLLGTSPKMNIIDAPEDAICEPGTLNVIDENLIPGDLAWGALSAVAGDAAYRYIARACRFAQQLRIDAICTAPLNKEALHLGGHIYPGHTEMLAKLTGTDEVSMMLSTPKLKVIHVTTHLGLIDAVEKIEPGLVERTIRRGHDALVAAGNPHPRIGVASINPHAGEGGLFGYGEEAEKIAPGVEAARTQGIDVTGPLPADTLFFLAGRGDYDLVVAQYHDQGHGPIKVLGIEAGVNITVGLPVIRTSVDHGTAFDIAGTGKADPRSMVEAMRQAIELAANREQA
ncbi:4-hydroxythreonine-4-phosphate dehydrogenase PdxA [Paramicrobacterium chengjingii]|uniref:4-hydroxythreonine-4-phosphate dehydrogenase PdxA n=1 Tax=Paramicrobacterium chengjingii TaxID=2769067 RepID=A0ABX6YKG0_9MICO|nr:4-hydroxythreonine-4-phosphate dehydrogenase PdxA [Microbacterium chengjingii]QPZ38835.1 4-hydroxythreonine-4-phosphate dehydrogenase PdxA [Microbacterium chengjingii]